MGEVGAAAKVMSSALPEAFVERLWRLLPEQAPAVLAAFAAPRVVAVRANSLRASPAAVWQALRDEGLLPEPVPWSPVAAVLPPGSLRAVQASAPFARGELYVQGLASMTAPLLLDPRPGERVLDLAAAPGSKTTQIAALMLGRGVLVANDRSRPRMFRLRAVLEQQGVVASELDLRVTCRPGEAFGRSHPGLFDRVLIDAPCSAEGRFQLDDPPSFAGWRLARIKRLAGQQERLLRAAVAATRPGGQIVYATCTLAPEENEAVVQRVLTSHAGALEVRAPEITLPAGLPGLTAWGSRRFDASLEHTRRLLPCQAHEGFFLARLVKHG